MAQPIRLALRSLDLFALIDKLFLASATFLPQLLDLCRIVIKAAESIEQPAVELRIHQSALVVLPMDFYEGRSQHPQGLGAHRRVIDKGTRASVGELDTPQDQLVLRRDTVRCQELAHRVCWRRLEYGGDLALPDPVAHQRCIAAGSKRERKGVKQNRFSRAGLARKHREPAGKVDIKTIDQDDIANRQPSQHQWLLICAGTNGTRRIQEGCVRSATDSGKAGSARDGALIQA